MRSTRTTLTGQQLLRNSGRRSYRRLKRERPLRLLRRLRNHLDSPTFVELLLRSLAEINDPVVLERRQRELRAFRRHVEEQADRLSRLKDVVDRVGVTGEVTLTASAVLGLITGTVVPLAALGLALSGMVVVGLGVYGSAQLDKGRTLYRQLAERMADIVKRSESIQR